MGSLCLFSVRLRLSQGGWYKLYCTKYARLCASSTCLFRPFELGLAPFSHAKELDPAQNRASPKSRETVLVQYDARCKLYYHCRCQPMPDPFPRPGPHLRQSPLIHLLLLSNPAAAEDPPPADTLPGFGLGPAVWTGVDIRIRRSARQNDCVVTLSIFMCWKNNGMLCDTHQKMHPPSTRDTRSSVTEFKVFVASRTGSALVPSLLSMV